MQKVLVRNKETKELYFVEQDTHNPILEALVSSHEAQQQETYVEWCVTNNLEPKNANSLQRYMIELHDMMNL